MINNTNLTEEQDPQYDIKDFTWFQFHLPVSMEDKDTNQTQKVEEAEPFETRFFFEYLLRHIWRKK